jgi:hypothetical protein
VSVYVDGVTRYSANEIQRAARRHGEHWSHLTADTEDELHAFAASIGLKRAWAQRMGTMFFHYDVIPSKRRMAVSRGAIEISRAQLAEILRARRAAGMPFAAAPFSLREKVGT